MSAIVPGGADWTQLPTLLSSQVPEPMAVSGFESPAIAYSGNGANVKTGRIIGVNSGLGNTITNPLNEDAKRLELAGAYGGSPCCAVCYGLALVAPGSGLLLQVLNGHAIAGGLVELLANQADLTVNSTIAVPDNTARVHIWLQQNGVLTYKTDTTQPASLSAYLGSCVTSGGVITSVENGGVIYLRGGAPLRLTADAGPPTDTPPSTCMFITKTLGGTYLWDGVAHTRLHEPLEINEDTIQASESLTIPAGYSLLMMEDLTVAGTLTVAGRLGILA